MAKKKAPTGEPIFMVVPVTDTRNDGGREPFNYSLVMQFDPNEWGLIQWAFKQPLAPELSEFLGRRI